MKRVSFIFIIILISAFNAAAQEMLSLSDCIQIALKNNFSVVTQRNLNEIEDENLTASYAGIMPTVDLNASSGRYEQGEVPDDFRDQPVGIDTLTGQVIYQRVSTTIPGFIADWNNFGINVNQNLFDGGEWWNAIKYAKSAKLSSDYDLLNVVNSTVLSVQESYFNLLKQQKLVEVNDLAVKRSQDQLEKTEKMFELGAVAKVDVYRSRVNLGNDRIELLVQKNNLLMARNTLNTVMGREPNTPLEIQPEFDLMPKMDDVQTLYENALKLNPELKKYAQDIRSAELQTSRSYSVLFPRLSAFFNYRRDNEEFSKVYSDFEFNWNITYGVSLNLNLFNGFRDKVNIQTTKLLEKNAREAYEENRRNVMASIQNLTDNFNSYLEIIEINEQNLEASREEFRLAEERYRIGSGTALEVREAQVNLTRAEQTLVAAQYNARITQAQLEKAMGTIYADNSEN